ENGMQSGVWPAFWMMGNDIESGAPWPYCGEIDIMEHKNQNRKRNAVRCVACILDDGK
ncbi:hypothetical protein DXA21_21215, partial [Parabacteroides distasonis]